MKMEETRPLRVGVIGLGLMGGAMVEAFSRSGAWELAAVADSDRERARAVAERTGAAVASSADALVDPAFVASHALDVIAIATPPASHATLTVRALEAGCHVICEKPMARTVSEAEEMVAAVRRTGRACFIDHQLRYNPARVRLRELLEAGRIGTPLHAVSIAYFPALMDSPWTWWSQAAEGGGLLYEYGSHTVDLLRWLFGEISAANGTAKTLVAQRSDADGRLREVDSDDFVSMHLEFASGMMADLLLSGGATSPSRRLEVHGTQGSIEVSADDVITVSGRDGETRSYDLREREPSLIGWEKNDSFTQPFARLIEEIALGIATGAMPSAACTADDGLAVIRVLDAVRVEGSYREGA